MVIKGGDIMEKKIQELRALLQNRRKVLMEEEIASEELRNITIGMVSAYGQVIIKIDDLLKELDNANKG